MGDLIALNDTSLEIGNRVWRDTNPNGIQDPGESGIGGLQVVLFSAAPHRHDDDGRRRDVPVQ